MLYDSKGNKMMSGPTALSNRGRHVNSMAIMEKITAQFKDKSRKDIQKWRSAITIAEMLENPRRDMLMDLIDDLMTDGHLTSQLEIRKSATLNTPFQIISKKSGDVQEEKTELFQAKWFYELLKHALDARFRGHSLIEFLSFEEGRIKIGLLERRNVVPNKGVVIPDLSKPQETLDYTQPIHADWIVEFGEKNDLGILNKIVPNLIWKRNIMQSWAEFCERFGIPLITATTIKQDTASLDEIEGMLSQLGEASHAVFPEGTTIDIKEANRADAYQVFDNLITRNNEEMSKPITGGTMLTDSGSSESQSRIHENNLEERLAPSDRREIEFIINDEVLPMLILRGFPFTEDDKFTFDSAQQIDLLEHWQIVKELEAKHVIDPLWISKKFNVPILGDRVETQGLPVTATAIVGESVTGIRAMEAMRVEGVRFPAYTAESCCEHHDRFAVSANYQDEMDSLHDELFDNIYNKKATLTQEAKIIAKEALRLLAGLRSGWGERAVTADWNQPDHLMLSLMEFNLFNFASSKTEARLASLSDLLIDKEKRGIRSFADFKEQATKITDNFNSSWLKTEYNLSVAVGQNSAAYSRAMEEQDVIPYWQYITAGDNNVRTQHQMLNNRVFALKDTTARTLFPPNEYGCRCEGIQYPYTPTANTQKRGRLTTGKQAIKLLGEDFAKSEFNVNRADSKKVFSNKQFYHNIKAFPEKISNMSYKNTYELADYKAFKDSLNAIKLDGSITPDNVAELFRLDGKQGLSFMGFTDYLNRKLILQKGVFNTHTTGSNVSKKEAKHQMFPHLESVVSKPDEVWLHQFASKKFHSRYIKYYNNMAFVVDVELGKNNLEIKSWYQMKVADKKVRKGILIKQMKNQ